MCASMRLSESERKKEIMDSAARVILKKGFAHATMEDVIAGTTLSKGGVYHYYSSVIDIFKDIMRLGNEHRCEMIRLTLKSWDKSLDESCMASLLVDKMLDDNPYASLYIEFLLACRRYPEFRNTRIELENEARESFRSAVGCEPSWFCSPVIFPLVSDLITAVMLASNVLESRDNLIQNRKILEKMLIMIFEYEVGG